MGRQLSIRDKIELIADDGSSLIGYMLDDATTYDGTLSATTRWQYDENDAEDEANPSDLGENLKRTYAKVDKVNKQVEITVSDIDTNKTNINTLLITVDGLQQTAAEIRELTDQELESLTQRIEELSTQITQTAENVKIEVKQEIQEEGADKITTSTGYTFDETGLTISKTGSEIETTITEDGMAIEKDGDIVLRADNRGVKAQDLHATTYLIIGENSRLENYESDRTACFWIGG